VRDQESLEIIDLDHLDLKHIHLMSGLAACWDTLGYIYYLRGDYEHAEPYLRSSFDLLQAPAAAEHLGDVYQELHQPAKAIRYYSLAANSLKPSEDAQDKLFRLQEAGVSEPPKWQPREEFGRMRTVKLPQITKQSTSAEFMVMLSNQTDSPTPPPHNVSKLSNGTVMVEIKRSGSRIGKAGSGKVEQVKFLSGAEQLRNADKLLRGKDLLTEFPDDTLTRIFRRGVLVCSPYITGCQFTLLTSDSVYSAN
jgi:tetratricopeptide (TPR) repeat protein